MKTKVRSLSQRYTVVAGDSSNGRLLPRMCRKEIFSYSIQDAPDCATKIINSACEVLGVTHMFRRLNCG